MTETTKSTGVYGIDASRQKVTTGKTKRKPKFSAGAELKNAVKGRKPKFSAGAELKKAVDK